MQLSHTGHGIDFTKIAKACGFADCATLTRIDEVEKLSRVVLEPAEGPRLYVIKVAAENPPRSLPPRDAVFVKTRFRNHLGFAPN
jgi:hypothetical protein